MNRAEEKAQRLLQIEQLLWAHPEGLTRAEIARRLGVNRSTITKYLDTDQLPTGVYEDDLDGNKLKMDRDADLTKASFSLHEVMAIHLATRLLATRSDKQNPHAASALRKLGMALQRLDSNVSGHLLRSADVMDEAAAFRDPVYLKVLETLTEAWSAGRKVQSQPPDGGRPDHRLGLLALLHRTVCRGPDRARDRLARTAGQRAAHAEDRAHPLARRSPTSATTSRPTSTPASCCATPGASGTATASRWRWCCASIPAWRCACKETRWHPSQQIEEQPDGYLIWRAKIAEPQEMLPWVRGWGGDVEVVGPEELREALEREVRRLTALYQVAKLPKPPLYQLLWAKAERKTGRMHPLICHMLDVAEVAQALWREVLTDSIRRQFADALGLDTEATGQLLAFWAALHDLGKASPAFQRQVKPLEAMLSVAGLSFPKLFSQEASPHGTISAWALEQVLQSETGMALRPAKRIALALGGHHGPGPRPARRIGSKRIKSAGQSRTTSGAACPHTGGGAEAADACWPGSPTAPTKTSS